MKVVYSAFLMGLFAACNPLSVKDDQVTNTAMIQKVAEVPVNAVDTGKIRKDNKSCNTKKLSCCKGVPSRLRSITALTPPLAPVGVRPIAAKK